MQCTVLRSFGAAGGITVHPGDVVDITGWRPRNVEGLMNNRYLRPVGVPVSENFDVTVSRRSGTTSRRRKDDTDG